MLPSDLSPPMPPLLSSPSSTTRPSPCDRPQTHPSPLDHPSPRSPPDHASPPFLRRRVDAARQQVARRASRSHRVCSVRVRGAPPNAGRSGKQGPLGPVDRTVTTAATAAARVCTRNWVCRECRDPAALLIEARPALFCPYTVVAGASCAEHRVARVPSGSAAVQEGLSRGATGPWQGHPDAPRQDKARHTQQELAQRAERVQAPVHPHEKGPREVGPPSSPPRCNSTAGIDMVV